jgi:carbon monoxide dehydrogenase subunit G
MPDAKYAVEVRAPIAAVWTAVSDMDRWAPLIPGYVSHDKVRDAESLWTLKGDVGILTKTVTFRVRITEWTEPSNVAFMLEGTDENVVGQGRFVAEPLEAGVSRITGYLELQQRGAKGPMVNGLLKGVMSKLTQSFVETLAREIEMDAGAEGSG